MIVYLLLLFLYSYFLYIYFSSIHYENNEDGHFEDDANDNFEDDDDSILTRQNCIKITRSVFRKRGQPGDFAWMIDRPEYSRSLFVFNDNEEQFYDFFTNKNPGEPGGGNGEIRPYQGHNPPRAIGVPTGTSKPHRGYMKLTLVSKKAIDDSMTTLLKLLSTGYYNTVIVSWNHKLKTLGSGIFKPSKLVKDYIFKKIESTVNIANQNCSEI
jgi:hypothetical protein